MKPIATNIADFEALRKQGLVYVDKTAYLHKLISRKGSTFFFCARPRRFGKSLSVTTLKSIFLGHREYFEDLAMSVVEVRKGAANIAGVAIPTQSTEARRKRRHGEETILFPPTSPMR